MCLARWLYAEGMNASSECWRLKANPLARVYKIHC